MSLFDFARPRDGGLSRAMREILEEYDRLAPRPLETLVAIEARRQATIWEAARLVARKHGLGLGFENVPSQEIHIPLVDGTISARLFGRARRDGALPLILFWHGGGFVMRDPHESDVIPRALAHHSQCLVLSCQYRLGPEYRFPAAHEDAWTAFEWARENAADLRADQQRIAVVGEGAGASLAAHVSLSARNQGIEPPVAQILICPMAGTDMGTQSYREHAHASPLNRAMLNWMLENYVNDPSERQDLRLNILGNELWGLPPTLIVAAQIDPLFSEGLGLAERLTAAEVPVTHKCYAGVTHGFFGMAPLVPEAVQAQAAVISELRKRFAHGLRGRFAHAFRS